MKNLFRIKKNFKRTDFNTVEEFEAYPSIAWKTHVRRKNGKIIIESGLLNCNSIKNEFYLFRITKIHPECDAEEIVSYSCKLNNKNLHSVSKMQRTLLYNCLYLVVRHSDFGVEQYLLSTLNNDFQVLNEIYGNEEVGYSIYYNGVYHQLDKKFFG